jgi:hypothetical protein
MQFDPNLGTLDDETKWGIVRQTRDVLLSRCDWTQLPDTTLTDEQKAAWATYRQALRDLPSTAASPDEIEFPARPSGSA